MMKSALPLIDLHRHIDGSVKDDIVLKRAKQHGIILPTDDHEEFSKINTIYIDDVRKTPLEINELLKRFAWAIAVMRTPEGLQEVAYNQVLDLAQENILYAELRFAPGYHSKFPAPFYKPEDYEKEPFRVLSLEEVMDNVIFGIEKGMKETGIEVNLTLCIPRECHQTYGLRSAFEIAELALRYQNRGVVALDLACDEFSHPPSIYSKVFRRTLDTNIRRDPHGGEMGINDEYKINNIESCIFDLFAQGVGHAVPLWKDKVLTSLVKNRRIRIERNPYQGDENYGIGELLDEGVLISVMSDDPVLMRQSLTQCYDLAIKQNNLRDAQVNKLIANAVNSAFYRDKSQERRVKEMFRKKGIVLEANN